MIDRRPSTLALALVIVALATPGAIAQDAAATEQPHRLLGLEPAAYQGRREALVRLIREDEVSGGGRGPAMILLRGADEPTPVHRFRQTSDFAYLTGCTVPGASLVVDVETGESVLYLPPSNPLAGRFDDASTVPGEPEAAASYFGVARVVSTGQLLAEVFGRLDDPIVRAPRRTAVVYVQALGPDEGDSAADPEGRLISLIKTGAPHARFRSYRAALTKLRIVKSAEEVAIQKQAIEVTRAAFDRVAAMLRPGVREWAVRGVIEGTFLERGAGGPGFPSIVGTGRNGAIPHHFLLTGTVGESELVVIDIGAEVHRYTADLTRTLPASGTFTARQRALYQQVLDAQTAAARHVETNRVSLAGLTQFTREFFNASRLRACDEDGREHPLGHFFITGVGHHVGLDVHDVGGFTSVLQPGHVFTIEPGLYIPSENLGIRIEDMYHLTADGLEKLSAGLPSEPEEVEAWIRGARLPAR